MHRKITSLLFKGLKEKKKINLIQLYYRKAAFREVSEVQKGKLINKAHGSLNCFSYLKNSKIF